IMPSWHKSFFFDTFFALIIKPLLIQKFEIYKDRGGEFRFRLKAANGHNILTSEGYKAKTGCTNGIESVRKNSRDDDRYERLESSSGSPYFNQRATNGQVIGTSEMYSSFSTMENGIASVKNNAPGASVEDLTQ